MKRAGAALATLATGMTGCAAPDRPPPPATTVTAPTMWRTELPATGRIDATWWEGFGDVELSRLVTAAIANNPDVAIAAARVAEARAQEAAARAARFPSLDAGVGITEQRALNALGRASTGTSAQPVFQAAYEVDLFGRIGNRIDAARLAGDATVAARDAARLSVAAATASGYVTLRGLDARIATVRATIASRAEALRIARSRAEAGYTSQLELRQAEAEYAGVAQTLPQLELAATRQENALSLLTGTAPRPIDRGMPLDRLVPPPVPAGLPSDLLRRRPDIAQAEATLAASDATLAVARGQFLPMLRLTGSTGEILSTALPNPVGIWSIGASVLAPLFRGGQLRAGVDTAAARRDQAAFAYQRTALTAFREVEDALAAIDRLAVQRRDLEAQRTALAETLRHATNRYRAGYSPYLEQLDAQRALFTAELSIEQVRTDQLTALIALYQAMGGGWSGQP